MNKKGGEKLLSIWWFLILVIVTIGIVAGVYIFYNVDVDVRQIEAGILNNKLKSCLVDGNFLKQGFLNEDFNIFQECSLSEEVLNESGEFYFRVTLKDIKGNIVKELNYGVFSFEGDCNARYENGEEIVLAEEYPKCVFGNDVISFIKDNNIEIGRLEILTASNQFGEVKVRSE